MEGFLRLVFKGIAILGFGTRENVVSFDELVYFLESVDTTGLDTFPSFVLAACKLRAIPLFVGQRPIGQSVP